MGRGIRLSLLVGWLASSSFPTALVFLSGSGAGFQVKSNPVKAQIGQDIVIGGLVFQNIMFGLFVVTTIAFHLRFGRSGDSRRLASIPWKNTLTMLYISSALVMARNIYRTVEFAMGRESYPAVNEWPTYVLDALPMLAIVVAFYWQFPSRLRRETNDDPTEQEPMAYSPHESGNCHSHILTA
jgi:hypothetical protein